MTTPTKKPSYSHLKNNKPTLVVFAVALVLLLVLLVLMIRYLTSQYEPTAEPTPTTPAVADALVVEPRTLETLSEEEAAAINGDTATDDTKADEKTDDQEGQDSKDSKSTDDEAVSKPVVSDRPTESSNSKPAQSTQRSNEPEPPPIRYTPPETPSPANDPAMQLDPVDEQISTVINEVRKLNEEKLAPVLSTPVITPATTTDTANGYDAAP